MYVGGHLYHENEGNSDISPRSRVENWLSHSFQGSCIVLLQGYVELVSS